MRQPLRTIVIATCGLATSLAAAAAPIATEFFHGGYGHYFVTASPQEASALDAGSPSGWSRTGQTFPVLDLGSAGAANVCRFWSGQAFAPKSSHFYTALAAECGKVKGNPDWKYEGEVFGLTLPDAAGGCTGGFVPLYRLYNNGLSGAPNHRYTTSLTIRGEMIAHGWTAEGAGIGVIGCVAPPSAPSVTVVAAGDIGDCGTAPAAESAAAKTAALVTSQDALVLTLGDHAYENGTPAEFANCFAPTWGAFKERIHPTPGNHDYYTADAAGYYGYFGAQAGPADRRGYYSFDFNGWHFISLNSLVDVSPTSAQYRWLAADLANARGALCTIAYWHYPRFNSGATYGNDETMKPFFELLYNAGVELLLSGNDHLYERFGPQTPDGAADPVRGVRQFVVGTGGHWLYSFGVPQPNSEFRDSKHFGVLRLTLEPASYTWQFVPIGGGPPLDSGTTACHP